MIFICPNCNVRIVAENHSVDIVHECDPSSEFLRNEDIVVSGDWEDFTGSDTEIGAAEVMMQGAANQLWGGRAWLEGQDHEELTSRGNRKSTHRTRQRLAYIDLQGGKVKREL